MMRMLGRGVLRNGAREKRGGVNTESAAVGVRGKGRWQGSGGWVFCSAAPGGDGPGLMTREKSFRLTLCNLIAYDIFETPLYRLADTVNLPLPFCNR